MYFYDQVLFCVVSFVVGIWLGFTAVVVNVATFLIYGSCFQDTRDAVY